MKFIVDKQINIKGFFKLTLSFYVCNKFAICNILRKKWVINLIFCMQLRMKISKKNDTIIFDGDHQAFPRLPK